MEQPFDWAAWNAQFDAGQLALAESLKRWNEAEAALAQSRIEMVRDVRALINVVGRDGGEVVCA